MESSTHLNYSPLLFLYICLNAMQSVLLNIIFYGMTIQKYYIIFIQGQALFDERLNEHSTTLHYMCILDGYTVLPQFGTLCRLLLQITESNGSIARVFHRVRVMIYTQGQRKLPICFFYGKISHLTFDLARATWLDYSSILDYSTPKGRALLCTCRPVEDLATKKWKLILPARFQFAWEDNWESTRARK
jgi:hypothetical protein